MAKTHRGPPKANIEAIEKSSVLLNTHALFRGLASGCHVTHTLPPGADPLPADGFLRIHASAYTKTDYRRTPAYSITIAVNPWLRAVPEEWAHVIAQAILHVLLNHVDAGRPDAPWRIAAGVVGADLVRQLSIGRRPDLLPPLGAAHRGAIEHLAGDIVRQLTDDPDEVGKIAAAVGLAGLGRPTWVFADGTPPLDAKGRAYNTNVLAAAFRESIRDAVESAGAKARGAGTGKLRPNSMAEQARRWFVANYPLLASLAAAFEIVEDAQTCEQLDIRIAAVDPEQRRIYINPHCYWTTGAIRFVMAHELLHVGLSHSARRQGRDPYLWNVACDYVINGWLVEMGVGTMPTEGLLDMELGLGHESAEAVYDRIVKDLRLMRRLSKFVTLAGVGKRDLLGERPPGWWQGAGCDLDTFYRRALSEGLDLHERGGRGTLPGSLIEEVRALQHPPIPWDVKLGQWLDAYFPPVEWRRSYRRASRRQSVTPDIPRPVHVRPDDLAATRTFGVVVDTSGSMPPQLIARAFGAIASYALSREVQFVRVVQCDAGVHDMGFVEAERLLDRIEVRGRGGTVLRPAIEHLTAAKDFPPDAPLLVITDGLCDSFSVPRAHAFLMPEGCRLPFRPMGPVFHFDLPGDGGER
jgi:predicted metal-dependent peptidase